MEYSSYVRNVILDWNGSIELNSSYVRNVILDWNGSIEWNIVHTLGT